MICRLRWAEASFSFPAEGGWATSGQTAFEVISREVTFSPQFGNLATPGGYNRAKTVTAEEGCGKSPASEGENDLYPAKGIW